MEVIPHAFPTPFLRQCLLIVLASTIATQHVPLHLITTLYLTYTLPLTAVRPEL